MPFKSGEEWNGNRNGRPKGKTMKEFAREFLMSMSDEAKMEFLNSLSKDIVWRMAEGNPANETDVTTGGKPIYLPAELMPKNDISQSPSNDSE